MTARRVLSVTLLVAVAIGRVACGCGDEPVAGPVDAGPDQDSGKRDASTDTQGDALAVDPACGVPGYLLDTGYNSACGFCYAASRAALPGPIKWKNCPGNATPAAVACRMMDFDWEPPNGSTPQYIESLTTGTTASDGSVVLGIYRRTSTGSFHVVASADGDVKQSLFEANPQACHSWTPSLGAGFVAYPVSEYVGDGGQQGSLGGSLAGSYDSLLPTVHVRHVDEGNEEYAVSELGLLELALAGAGTVRRYRWDTGAFDSTLYVGADHGVALAFLRSQGRSAFWDGYLSLAINKEIVWTEDGGAKDLISFGADTSQAATALGTDGNDLVWHYGSQRVNAGQTFPKNDVMTAPYTTDPAQLKPRRLRSDGLNLPDHYVVGCGYAAHSWTLDPNGIVGGVLLVRIADGQSWNLGPMNNAPWVYQGTIALTCTELFAIVAADGIFNVARIRLDSLGPGVLPD